MSHVWFYFHSFQDFNPSTAAALHWVACHFNHRVTSLTLTVSSAVSLLRSCDSADVFSIHLFQFQCLPELSWGEAATVQMM